MASLQGIFFIENESLLKRDNLYRFGVIPTLSKKARALNGKVNPWDSYFPVELFANKDVKLLSLCVKSCFYLYFVDCVSNTIIKEIELTQYYADKYHNGCSAMVHVSEYHTTIVVDDRFVLVNAAFNLGISESVSV